MLINLECLYLFPGNSFLDSHYIAENQRHEIKKTLGKPNK